MVYAAITKRSPADQGLEQQASHTRIVKHTRYKCAIVLLEGRAIATLDPELASFAMAEPQ